MFRRPGKNPLDKENSPLYGEETTSTTYKYGAKQDMNVRSYESPSNVEEKWANEKTMPLPHHFQGMLKEEPETTLGEGVTFKGELTFERLLRIDGTFEGELLSQGKVIIG